MSRPESHQNGSPSEEPALPRGRTRRSARAPADRPKQVGQSNHQEAADTPGLETSEPLSSSPAEPLFGWTFRDFLVPYILLALSMQRAHGYFIEQYLRGLGLVNVELSTLYRTLRQMERDGLVYSTWEPGPEGPARRIYSLTDAGRWWLDAGAAALAGYRAIIDRFFGSYSGPVVGPNRDDEKGASR